MLITLSTLCICAATGHMAKSLCGKVKIFHCSAANLLGRVSDLIEETLVVVLLKGGGGLIVEPSLAT